MKLPIQLMIALLVSTAPLYVSHRMDWKESSRAPSLANSSARSLPAAMKRPVSPSLARSALERCALHFVTESVGASSPMSRKHFQIFLHTSACCLLAAVHHFGPRSRPHHCRSVRYEHCSWFRQDDGLPQCPQLCPQDTPLHWERSAWHPPCDPCLHIKEPSTNRWPPVANNTWVYPHIVEFVDSRSLSLMLVSRRKVHADFSEGWTCPQSMLR